MNENLIPAVIIDLVTKYKAAKDINEKTALENRLTDIRNYLNEVLRNQSPFRL
jgi:hypothetical protein